MALQKCIHLQQPLIEDFLGVRNCASVSHSVVKEQMRSLALEASSLLQRWAEILDYVRSTIFIDTLASEGLKHLLGSMFTIFPNIINPSLGEIRVEYRWIYNDIFITKQKRLNQPKY